MTSIAAYEFEAFAGAMVDAVILADADDRITYVNRSGEVMFGYGEAELVGQKLTDLMSERYRAPHLAGMQRVKRSGATSVVRKAIELHGLRKDGSEFPIVLSVTSWEAAHGIIFSGIIQDQSERKRRELRDRTQVLITRLIAESNTLMEAVTRVIKTICASMEWEVGAMWIRDPRTDALRCVQLWDSKLRRSEFEQMSLAAQFRRGEGLPGVVWESGKAIWTVDTMTDPIFMRRTAAAEIGLHTSLSFPVIDPKQGTIGTLEFFTSEERPPDQDVLHMMEAIGHQIGSLLERAHAAEAVLTIVEQMQVGVFVYRLEDPNDDHSLRLISANPAAAQIVGIPAGALVGRLIDENFPGLRKHRIPEIYQGVVRTQESVDLDEIVYSDSRVTRGAFAVKAFPLPSNCVGVAFEDITKRKAAELLLRAERRILERMAEGGTSFKELLNGVAIFSDQQTPGMYSSVLLLSRDGRQLVSAAAPHLPRALAAALETADLSGIHSPATLATARRESIIVESIAADDRADTIRAAALAHEFSACWAMPIISRSDAVIGAMVLFFAAERAPDRHELEVTEFAARMAAIIIERHRAEESLRRSEARYRALIENSADAVHLHDANRRIIFRSPASQRILGYADEEILGHDAVEFAHPDDREQMVRKFRESATAGASTSMWRVRHRDGHWIWAAVRIMNLLDDHDVGSLLVTFRDVTEQYLAEQTLRQSEERFNAFMRNVPLVAFVKDAESRYIWINEKFESLFGMRLGDVMEKNDFDLFDRRTAEQNVLNDRQVLETGAPVESSGTMTTGRGAEREFLTLKFPLSLPSGARSIGGVAVDVTERNALEKQLERTERVSSLGRLAANIAHEINNVLMGILPFAEIIRRKADDDPRLGGAADQIVDSVERGRRITQEILGFARAAEPVRRSFGCRSWLAKMIPELRGIVGRHITIDAVLPDTDVYIYGDELQLQQVMTNLVMNARDAMAGRGTLTIAAEPMPPNESSLTGASTCHAIHLLVRDTGRGIPEDVIGRIFEPMFTTKKHGTGLGLAISHQVIGLHGGTIHVESTPGAGTTFHLVLPCSSREEKHERTTAPSASPRVKRVVLVEDELAVGQGLVDLLESDGVQVHWVQLGVEAAAAIAAFDPDVVILDVGLPDINGVDLYRDLVARFPSLRVVFSTGHGEAAVIEQLRNAPVVRLQKPYDYKELLAAIAAVTQESPA